jgi:hypothetical protein
MRRVGENHPNKPANQHSRSNTTGTYDLQQFAPGMASTCHMVQTSLTLPVAGSLPHQFNGPLLIFFGSHVTPALYLFRLTLRLHTDSSDETK